MYRVPEIEITDFILHNRTFFNHTGNTNMPLDKLTDETCKSPKGADTSFTNNVTPSAHERKYKSNNPFANGKFDQDKQSEAMALDANGSVSAFEYVPTSIPKDVLKALPFKTSNRILDDLKFTPALKQMIAKGELLSGVLSLLNSPPLSYKDILPSLFRGDRYETLILNNVVDYIPLVEKRELTDQGLNITFVRGLIHNSSTNCINHFKITILEKSSASFAFSIDKHEYHIIPRDMISADDLIAMNDLSVNSSNLIDDAYFKSANSTLNHILRVSVYTQEFMPESLKTTIDQSLIKERYLKGVEKYPNSQLNPDSIPGPVHCLQTLLKVLKGPINLKLNEPIHTISKTKTFLDAKLDVLLLFEKLSFTLGDDDDSLVPPNLSRDPALRESYIRKAYELIFLGKSLKTKGMNDFDVKYSFSDNLAQIYSVLSEVDKHAALSSSGGIETSKFPFFVALSCSPFYQDELIIHSYENTVFSDPKNKMYYVDCFKRIMDYRTASSTSRLSSYYNNQYMKGLMYGFSDYENALKAIGIDFLPMDGEVDPSAIIEMYKTACKLDQKNYSYFNKQLEKIATLRDDKTLKEFLKNEILPMSIALNELRIEEVTEDEVVITAFEFRLNDIMQENNFNPNSPEINLLQRSLYSVALGRKSYILLNYIDRKFPDLKKLITLSYSEAVELLGVKDSSTDFEIISTFQEKLAVSTLDDPVDVRVLRAALGRLAEERKSQILLSFLEKGSIDSSLLPPEAWPTGLDNIGNTCYLNSLLQYYFSIKPLREMILNFDEENVKMDTSIARKIGGRNVELSELKRSNQFIYRLQSLFQEMISTKQRCVQPSKELAYLSFLALSQPVDFKDSATSSDLVENDEGESVGDDNLIVVDSRSPEPECVDIVMDEADDNIIDLSSFDEKAESEYSLLKKDVENEDIVHVEYSEDERPVQKKILNISPDQIESTIEVGRQQDVTECIENVTYQIETALEPEYIESDGEQFDLIKKLFCGKTKQTITPLNLEGGEPRVSFERFFSLIINVGDHPKDIYDALDNYFNEDLVELEDGEAKKSLTILEMPELLQFHVQRVLFDRERLVAYKSLEVIPFGEKIHLDRYLETDDEGIKAKRQEVFDWKSEIRKLNVERDEITQVDPQTNLSAVDALNATLKYLEQNAARENLPIKQKTIDSIRMQIHSLKLRLQSIDNRLAKLQTMVSTQFDSYQKVGYSLFAIFIHRGEASYGHYWVYIKDPHKNIYRKYNDDTVSEVPYSEVFNFTTTNTATPYYMVYVKTELMNEYIEPLKRIIKD